MEPPIMGQRGIVKIKNVSGGLYEVEEMPGITIPDQEEIDLLDPELDPHYADFESAQRLVQTLETAKLRQSIVGGDIEIVELKPPIPDQ